MEVPGAEGRGAVVPGTETGLNGGRQSAEQLGFPGMIKVGGDMGAGPCLRNPLLYPVSLQYHLDYCSMYTDHSVCSRDPECSWCQGACQAALPPGTPSGAVSDCPGTLSPSTETSPLLKASEEGLPRFTTGETCFQA